MYGAIKQLAWIGTGECTIVNYVAKVFMCAAILATPIIYYLIVRSIVRANNKHGRVGKAVSITVLTIGFALIAAYVIIASGLIAACDGSIIDF